MDQVWAKRMRLELLNTEIEAVAELGKAQVTPGQLLKFKVGDILMLTADVSEPLTLKVEGIEKIKGYPGVYRGNKAIQVDTIIERES